jgi:membrane associated rhomboid family serine protease
MLSDITRSFAQIFASFQTHLPLLLIIIAILTAIQILNALLGYRLNNLGILPRSPRGLIGVITSPFLHGGFGHLFSNIIPLFILSALILVNGQRHFFDVTILIVLFSGIGVWLFGRHAMHVGASSVVMGYWGFVLATAYQQRSMVAILLAIICLYYLSWLIFSLFPQDRKVSWEGHLLGFLAGLLTSYLFANHYAMVVSWLH